MKKKFIFFISMAICCIQLTVVFGQSLTQAESPRKMEYLNRGLVAAKVSQGVYLSWRLLGTEEIDNQSFDVYKNDQLIHTTGITAPTCYTDQYGKVTDKYKVVKSGAPISEEKDVTVWDNNITGSSDGVINSASYFDIPIDKPEDGVLDMDGSVYTYTAGDASVGDVDGDGEYEIILKWDPSNQKDNGSHGYTGTVYIDAYKLDGTKLWRIDMGKNIRAGAHYTQFIVYDFDSDGKAEVAMKTAPGTIDGSGNYVTDAGNIEAIKNANNNADYRTKQNSDNPQRRIGHIMDGPEYLTMFDGGTGKALQTIEYEPARGQSEDWGDGYGNRCNRYLAGVAYLDGQNPSLIMCRGYYARSAVVAYDWDGMNFNRKWILDSNDKGNESFGGQGNHSLMVADMDRDGCDEIVYGSAVVDNDGRLIYSTGHGHGDVLHVSDFDNDGWQEIFQSHEDWQMYDGEFGTEYRRGISGEILFNQIIREDVAKGVMGNFDDRYAVNHPDSKSLFWTSSLAQFYDNNGKLVAEDNSSSNRRFFKYFLYWDDKLDRELLDGTMLAKLRIEKENKFERFYFGRTGSFTDVNATTGGFPVLTADIFGDWREEVIMRTDDTLRIYMSCLPTEYRIPTLMHDSQYRTGVAAENVAYNQVPHTSYYIGSLALAQYDNGDRKNYLSPQTKFTNVEMVEKYPYPLRITDINKSNSNIKISVLNYDEPINGVIILSVFNSAGEMIDLFMDKREFVRYGNEFEIEGIEHPYFGEEYIIKVFIWDDIGEMHSLCDYKTYQQ